VTATDVPAPSTATGPEGLSEADVRRRVSDGQTNQVDETTSRTVGEIVRANVLTRFNAILAVLAVAVLATGRLGDALFAVVLVLNALIGIVQELRAKRTLDRLALLHAPTARVVRGGGVHELPVAEVVLDDLLELRSGDQVPADGILLEAAGLEIDESALTGESDPVPKHADGEVLSGTVVLAGSGRFQATAVGADAYARRLSAEVKVFTRARSELQEGINTLLRYITWIILGVTPLLVWSQFRSDETGDWREPVTGTVAALVGMVPEGLVLLTSISFFLAALALTRRRVLVQELPAVEGLARVDVVCLDKTGTLTLGDIEFDRLVALEGGHDEEGVRAALGAMAAAPDANASLAAIGVACAHRRVEQDGPCRSRPPGSGARRRSATTGRGSSAPTCSSTTTPPSGPVAELAAQGRRVLLAQSSPAPLSEADLPGDRRAEALVTLAELIRPDAADTLRFFQEKGLGIRIISGDNPATVAAIATDRTGRGEPIDARTLGEDEDLAEAVAAHVVFGRVSPHQKRSMVRALQAQGHIVAMTGDGVNDAMALKDADIGVAMGNAAQATKAAAQLVLLDGEFSRMPRVLAEGRRVIGNIERVSSLFVSKNTYSFLLVLLVSIAGLPYPFLPRHLTLISSITIGIPAFFLALGPNPARYRPGFLRRVLAFAVPSGAIVAVSVFLAYLIADLEHATTEEKRTSATIAALVVALWILAVLARPVRAWKAVLVVAMAGVAVAAVTIPPVRELFELEVSLVLLPQALAIGAGGAMAVELVGRLSERDRPEEPRASRSTPG
jgi:cation-transporting ATPase E